MTHGVIYEEKKTLTSFKGSSPILLTDYQEKR